MEAGEEELISISKGEPRMGGHGSGRNSKKDNEEGGKRWFMEIYYLLLYLVIIQIPLLVLCS